MKKHLNIGLVGFGFMGKTHLYAIQNLPFFCDLPFTAGVSAFATSHPGGTHAPADALGICEAVSPEALIGETHVDIIDVCTPNPSHFSLVRQALAAGKHVLCEKPLTVTAAEADELCRLAKASGLTCGTVFNNRYLAPVLRAKELIGEGRLGRILSFDFAYRHNSCIDPERRVGWKQRSDFGGGTLYDLGPHVIDLCHLLCGPAQTVMAQSQIAFPTHRTSDGGVWKTDADEAFYLLMTTEGGAHGTLTVSKLTQGANDSLTFSVWGTDGAISFDLMNPNFLFYYDATAPGTPLGGVRGYTAIECVGRYPAPATGFPAIKAPSGWLRGHVGCMADYLSAVFDGRPASPSFDDGAYCMHVLEAAVRSDRERRAITVS